MNPRVCQVSLSNIDTDPRLQKTISTLEAEGYDVIPVGYGCGIVRGDFDTKAKLLTALCQIPARFVPGLSHQLYWTRAENQRIYHLICEAKPDIIHAHDWPVLPAAARAASELGARLVYDSHEFGREQLGHRALWRQVYPVYISSLENRNAKLADAVITVSDGCGRLLQEACNLKAPPIIIRNTPHHKVLPFRPTRKDNILVQFNGFFTPGRGLRNLIKSVPLWPEAYRLRLTGWAENKNYFDEITALADRLAAGRIEFHDKVRADQLLSHSNSADIGVVFADTISAQFEISLPNKLFEYIMSGLMVVVGPGNEMHELVARHDLGITHDTNRPEVLATTFSNLSVQQIDNHKKAALQAAFELSWEREQVKLLETYEILRIPTR